MWQTFLCLRLPLFYFYIWKESRSTLPVNSHVGRGCNEELRSLYLCTTLAPFLCEPELWLQILWKALELDMCHSLLAVYEPAHSMMSWDTVFGYRWCTIPVKPSSAAACFKTTFSVSIYESRFIFLHFQVFLLFQLCKNGCVYCVPYQTLFTQPKSSLPHVLSLLVLILFRDHPYDLFSVHYCVPGTPVLPFKLSSQIYRMYTITQTIVADFCMS